MEVKFNRRLDDYNYILSFDLAKHKTGYALIDFKSKKIEKYGLIVTDKENIMPWDYFYSKLREIIEEIRVKTNGNNFFVIKERLPNQNGPRSSIAALQELAKAHAVFDLFVAQNGIDYYDYIGIHSVSVKSYYKTQYGIEKPQKIDIFHCLQQEFGELKNVGEKETDDWSLDVSDAIALAQTLVNRKWNADIDAAIKEEKKKIKELKNPRSIEAHQNNIEKLLELKN